MKKKFSFDEIVSEEKGSPAEEVSEVRLRPKSIDEFIGQPNIIENIKLMTESSRIRKQAMDHVLLSGPPGLGKTSLALIISETLGSNLHVLSAPAIDKKGDLASILTNLEKNDVLFIDEIHRLNIVIEEILYSAMEDFRLDILIGQGSAARSMQIDIPPFTLVGATTQSGLLSNPLRDRFIAHFNFEFYNIKEMKEIVERNGRLMEFKLSPLAVEKIAKCCRSTPRILNRILRRLRDYVIVNKITEITEQEVESTLRLLNIDCLGLGVMDRKILGTIIEHYNGGPVGIDALSATLREEKSTIEEVYEPYLLLIGLLQRTSRGRVVTHRACEHLGH